MIPCDFYPLLTSASIFMMYSTNSFLEGIHTLLRQPRSSMYLYYSILHVSVLLYLTTVFVPL